MKQKLKGELDKSTVTAGDFNILSRIHRTRGQKISKDTEDADHTTNKLDLNGIYIEQNTYSLHVPKKQSQDRPHSVSQASLSKRKITESKLQSPNRTELI